MSDSKAEQLLDCMKGMMDEIKNQETIMSLAQALVKDIKVSKDDKIAPEDRALMMQYATFRLLVSQFQLKQWKENLDEIIDKGSEEVAVHPDIDFSKLNPDLN